MTATDVSSLMGLGAPGKLAELINNLIGNSQEIDALKGITFNTTPSTPFTIHTTRLPSTDVPPQYCESLIIGYNVATGTPGVVTFPPGDPPNPVKITEGEPCFRMALETNWHQIGSGLSDKYLFEWNFDYTNGDGTFTERPFFWHADIVRDQTYMYHKADAIDVFSPLWCLKNKAGDTIYAMSDEDEFTATRLFVGFGSSVLAGYGSPNLIIAGASGAVFQTNTNPNWYLDCTDAGANSRIWGVRANSSAKTFFLSAMNDAGTVETVFFKATRSGTTITKLSIPCSLPAYANNAAAIAGGLAAGDLYRTNGDPDTVCIVH